MALVPLMGVTRSSPALLSTGKEGGQLSVPCHAGLPQGSPCPAVTRAWLSGSAQLTSWPCLFLGAPAPHFWSPFSLFAFLPAPNFEDLGLPPPRFRVLGSRLPYPTPPVTRPGSLDPLSLWHGA